MASPDADPLELQVSRLSKKIAAGAAFLITQPVFDLERFDAWWKEVTRRGIHEKVAILAGIQPLGPEELAAARRRASGGHSSIPKAMHRARRARRATRRPSERRPSRSPWKRSRSFPAQTGLRGFAICGDGESDTALEIIEKSGLGSK